MEFKKAERKKAKLRLAITGPSGAGKTYSALLLAKGMGKKIAVIDTEKDSASLYSDLFDFDTLSLEAPFSPDRYIEAINAAVAAGYEVLIIDSMSHEWNGSGGCLEMVDKAAKTRTGGNAYAAWSHVTPKHTAFLHTVLHSDIHIITTMRSKQDFILVEDSKGRTVPQKIGLAPIQRDGIEYEFTAILDISLEGNYASVSKDRTRILSPDGFVVTEAHGKRLIDWLDSGIDMRALDFATLDTHTATIQKCSDMESLKASFMTGIAWAKTSQYSSELIELLTKAKDETKSALTTSEGDDE